nr:uncharacterized protein LOC129281453 [Lytechinus pictus]
MDSSSVKAPATKKVGVAICSGSLPRNVEGLKQQINTEMSDLVENVRYESLPYNVSDLDKFDFDGIDVMILCHSIDNRRFSITNVTDSLYDGFLKRAKNHLGKSKVGVIAHDFSEDDLTSDKLSTKMASFLYTQPTTYQCASLVLIGGQLAKEPVQLSKAQLDTLRQFLKAASTPGLVEIILVALLKLVAGITCGLLT